MSPSGLCIKVRSHSRDKWPIACGSSMSAAVIKSSTLMWPRRLVQSFVHSAIWHLVRSVSVSTLSADTADKAQAVHAGRGDHPPLKVCLVHQHAGPAGQPPPTSKAVLYKACILQSSHQV